ncbi:Bug family tripartite tricarboxylate transporter substrate binding protein [Ottowia sp. VDI28]|uniref:Bug family tripartite tricarboxylate transporter substrate binding protein n=1 Tax=Ottowia sp. VDI28 TaxID=3133968 RepID=UPI003C2B1286
MPLRRAFTLGAAFLAMSLATPLVHAQGASAGAPLRFVVPFPPGDGLETAARVLVDLVAKDLNTTIVIDNRPGASGAIAAETVSRTHDGKTFLVGTTAIMGITPFVRTAPYSPADFVPVAKFAHISAVMAIRNEIPARNWAEFVALAKAAPGKYTYATPGDGTLTHLAMVTLTRHAGIDMVAVPYKGMGPALQDFVGGRLDVYTEPAVVQTAKAGKVRAIAVNSAHRLAELPDVPTYDEAGIKTSSTPWIGLLAPKGTPPALNAQLTAAFRKAVSSPEFASRLPAGIEAAYSNAEDFGKQLQTEQDLYKRLIGSLNLKLQ